MAQQVPVEPEWVIARRPYILAWTYRAEDRDCMLIIDPDRFEQLKFNLTSMSPLQRGILREYLRQTLEVIGAVSGRGIAP